MKAMTTEKPYLELGPERNRHSRGWSFSNQWLTLGASSKGRKGVPIDIIHNLDNDWPLPSDRFEIVFSSHVLEHMKDPEHFVREAYRVLAPGGVMRVGVPDAHFYTALYEQGSRDLFATMTGLRGYRSEYMRKVHRHPFDKPTLRVLLEHGSYRLSDEPYVMPTETLFELVHDCGFMESSLEVLRRKYFSNRSHCSIWAEGVKNMRGDL